MGLVVAREEAVATTGRHRLPVREGTPIGWIATEAWEP